LITQAHKKVVCILDLTHVFLCFLTCWTWIWSPFDASIPRFWDNALKSLKKWIFFGFFRWFQCEVRPPNTVQLNQVLTSRWNRLKNSKNIHFFRFSRALSQNLGVLASNGLQIRAQHVKKHRNTWVRSKIQTIFFLCACVINKRDRMDDGTNWIYDRL